MLIILTVATFLGLGAGALRGGSISRVAELRVHLGWLAILSMLVQVYVVYGPDEPLGAQGPLRAGLMMASYVALLGVVWANRHTAGVSILGLGLILNFAVMAANGGYMPITREAVLASSSRAVQDLPAEGARIPRTKDVLLPTERTRLWFLSDILVTPPIPVTKVYSLGDLAVGVGIFVLVCWTMLPAGAPGRTREEHRVGAS